MITSWFFVWQLNNRVIATWMYYCHTNRQLDVLHDYIWIPFSICTLLLHHKPLVRFFPVCGAACLFFTPLVGRLKAEPFFHQIIIWQFELMKYITTINWRGQISPSLVFKLLFTVKFYRWAGPVWVFIDWNELPFTLAIEKMKKMK